MGHSNAFAVIVFGCYGDASSVWHLRCICECDDDAASSSLRCRWRFACGWLTSVTLPPSGQSSKVQLHFKRAPFFAGASVRTPVWQEPVRWGLSDNVCIDVAGRRGGGVEESPPCLLAVRMQNGDEQPQWDSRRDRRQLWTRSKLRVSTRLWQLHVLNQYSNLVPSVPTDLHTFACCGRY